MQMNTTERTMADSDLVERAQAALHGVTPGPWRVLEGKHGLQVHSERFWIANIKCEACPGQEAQNAAFIPAARDLVPAMAARIEALERELAGLLNDLAARATDAQSEIDKNRRDVMPSRTVEDIALGRLLCAQDALAAHRARTEGKG